jgi:hypothetical protein
VKGGKQVNRLEDFGSQDDVMMMFVADVIGMEEGREWCRENFKIFFVILLGFRWETCDDHEC